jgi:hypothetical protein
MKVIKELTYLIWGKKKLWLKSIVPTTILSWLEEGQVITEDSR